MKIRHVLLFLYLFFGSPCFAQSFSQNLPDKPQPQPAGHVADREFWAEAGLMGAAWTADTITTHQMFAANPYTQEGGILANGSRSTPKVMGEWAAVDLGSAIVAYEWKKHVRNRYLHPLWHVFMLQRVASHSEGAANNLSLPSAPLTINIVQKAQ